MFFFGNRLTETGSGKRTRLKFKFQSTFIQKNSFTVIEKFETQCENTKEKNNLCVVE